MDILSHKLRVVLNNRRKNGRLIDPPLPDELKRMADFGTNDTLSLSTSGALSERFMDQLRMYPNFDVGGTSSRIFEGTKQYLIDIEHDLAKFHGAEVGMFFNSGYDANVAVWSTLPQPGDIVLYDEYAHASIHDGMRRGRAKTIPFRHNSCDSLRDCLKNVLSESPGISKGENVVFISLESFYSMDGDAAPVRGLIEVARKELPLSNFLFSIDEAHSNGLVGPNGSGFVCYHGLEKEFPIRVNTCGKALGSAGAILLCSEVLKETLVNYSRGVIFSTAPSFVTVAAVRAGYELLASADGQKRRHCLQQNIYHFHGKLTSHAKWEETKKRGILKLPTEDSIHSEPFLSPIVPLVTPPQKATDLAKRLQQAKYWVNAVQYPVVPKDMDRIRIVLHAHNTEKQIEDIVKNIMDWASELLDAKMSWNL